MDLMNKIRKNEDCLKRISFALEQPEEDNIVDFCKTEMKKDYISDVVKLATVGSISCSEAASIIQNLQSSAYGLARSDTYEEVVELHEPCSDDGKKLIACSCKMCGGRLDNNFTCMFCGTKYVWR